MLCWKCWVLRFQKEVGISVMEEMCHFCSSSPVVMLKSHGKSFLQIPGCHTVYVFLSVCEWRGGEVSRFMFLENSQDSPSTYIPQVM